MYCTPDGYPLDKKNTHNVNGITIDERYNMCTAQGVCVELLGWWSSKCGLRHIGVRCMDLSSMMARHAKIYDDFPIIFLLEEAVLLLEYKFGSNETTDQGLLVAAPVHFVVRD